MRHLSLLAALALAASACGQKDPCANGGCATGGGSGGSGGSGTGGGGPSCSTASCEGCCDANGVCQLGLSATACGYGKACAVCAGSQACVGLSNPTCVDATCSGCSDSTGACITTLTDTRCGKGGAACFSCADQGSTCSTASGVCTGGGCGGCRDGSGICQAGNTKGACGTGGQTCAVCGQGQVCSNFQCAAGGTGGGSGGSGGGAAGGSGGAGGSAGGNMDTIPDPGNAMNAEWTDVEPNDRPGQAVPVGVLGTVWAGFAMPYTTINSATDKDYFVFRTGTATQLMTSSLALCWSGMFNLLDMTLYSVDAQNHQGAVVANWASTASGCETGFQGNAAAAGLMPNTVYLLEVRAGPGAVTPTQYSA